MKTLGIIVLFTIFFIGAFEFGVHQTMMPLVHKTDSLEICLKQAKSKDSLLHRQMDTMRRQLAIYKMPVPKKALIKKYP
jgi:hypothetical protein